MLCNWVIQVKYTDEDYNELESQLNYNISYGLV
jgi:hypothetical protein